MRKAIVAACGTLLGVALLGATSPAEACGEAMWRMDRLDVVKPKPSPPMAISQAERALENGDFAVAAQTVRETFGNIRAIKAGEAPLKTRAMRVLALALVRSEGKASVAGDWTPRSNLEWALASLQEVDAKRPNDPAVQADVAEAMSRLPHRSAEALEVLSKLAEKDLLGSPHAYAALARLRKESGDLAGTQVAIKRCEEMAKNKKACGGAVVASAPQPVPAKLPQVALLEI